ncbi:hypothetical protein ACLB2K_043994 [Fragaria x ananassa]
MATSAFKSTTKRTPIGSSAAPAEDSASVNRSHRRSRSLSCFSRRLQEAPAEEFEVNPTPRRKFVNTVRGSGFPEISLDDLAIELFDSGSDERGGRSVLRSSETTPAGASQRRGRSVSRHGPRVGGGGGGGETRGRAGNSSGGGRVVSESKGNMRQRRSVSVARYQMSDSESDLDHTHNRSTAKSKNFTSGNNQTPLSGKSLDSNYRPGLRRSLSQKDLKCHDGYSNQSSVLTDDEGKDAYIYKNGAEKTIRAVYSEKKAQHPAGNDMKNGLYEEMRKELRHAVEEIKTELKQEKGKTKSTVPAPGDSLRSNGSDVLQTVSSIRKNYSSKLEQRSNDKGRVSKRLTEEAERYIEDFISNVEDTDISSLDGERSDTSSSIGGIMRGETFQSPAMSTPPPVFMDGVVLPWLQWETSNEGTPMGCRNKTEPPMTPKSFSWGASQEVSNAQDHSQSASSRGSWSPGIIESLPFNIMENASSKIGESGTARDVVAASGLEKYGEPQEEALQYHKAEFDGAPHGTVGGNPEETPCKSSPTSYTLQFVFSNLFCIKKSNSPAPGFLINPLKGEVLRLPPCQSIAQQVYGPSSKVKGFWSGMGFDSITNTYKILCVAWIRVPNSPITERWCYVSLMLVLGTSEWRHLPSSLPCLAHFKPSKGICAHGDMHWLVSSRREGIRGHAHILSFDFKKEEFCWIPNPYRLPDMNRGLHLIMLRGSMAVVDTTSGTNISIWVMKDYTKKQWKLDYSFNINKLESDTEFKFLQAVCCEWEHGIYTFHRSTGHDNIVFGFERTCGYQESSQMSN